MNFYEVLAKRMGPSPEQFSCVVAPLVFLDLLVINEKNEILVGRRKFPPAEGYLLVPGGWIWKSESLGGALKRISRSEIGVELTKQNAVLYGVYDQAYYDNFWHLHDVSTRYVAIACLFHLNSSISFRSDGQYEQLHAMPIAELLADPRVHPYTRNYFLKDPVNLFLRSHRLPSAENSSFLSEAISSIESLESAESARGYPK